MEKFTQHVVMIILKWQGILICYVSLHLCASVTLIHSLGYTKILDMPKKVKIEIVNTCNID